MSGVPALGSSDVGNLDPTTTLAVSQSSTAGDRTHGNPSAAEGDIYALDDNRPSNPSPLRDSTVLSDLDPSTGTSQDVRVPPRHAASNDDEDKAKVTPVESVLGAIGGAAVAAPGAAIEVLTNKASELINSESSSADNPSSSTGASTGSVTNTLSQVQAQASSLASTASERAAGLSQAATEKLSGLVDQAKQNLPPQVASLLPGGVGVGSGAAAAASGTASSGLSTGDIVHQEPQHDITSQTRETTSAPIVESQQEDRATSVSKPLVPGSSGPAPTATSSSFSSTSSSAPGISQVGVVRDDTNTDITEAHTTGTFAATGQLQATNNPEIVEARPDLAVRAENGDL